MIRKKKWVIPGFPEKIQLKNKKIEGRE